MSLSSLHRTASRDEELRQQQIEEARRMESGDEAPGARRVLHLNRPAGYTRPAGGRNAGDAKRPPLKGHEAFLKALELSNADVVVEKCDGVIYGGKLKHSDKYTITLRTTSRQDHRDAAPVVNEPVDRVIFKHDISEFHTTSKPRSVVPDLNTEEGHAV